MIISIPLLSTFYQQNKTLVFTLLILLLALFVLIAEEFLITEDLYYDYFGQQLSVERIDSIIEQRNNWQWLAYVSIPIIYLFKFLILSTWMLTGIIFFGYRASFNEIFRVVMISEFVFLFPVFIKTIWFGFINVDFTIEELSYFVPLSLANLFNLTTLDPWWIYPLQSISVFEALYILLLAFGIGRIVGKNYGIGLKLTLPIYISGLLTWIIFVTFLTLSFS